MIKDIKRIARECIKQNYNIFLLPTLLNISCTLINYFILNVATNYLISDYFNSITSQWAALVVYLFISIVIIPFSTLLLFGAAAKALNVIDNYSVKNFININTMLKIVLINLIPSVIAFLYNNYLASEYSSLGLFMSNEYIYLLLIVLQEYILYKFFACNYFFIIKNLDVKETIIISFLTMKKQYFKFVLLRLSFILWELLMFAINIVVYILLVNVLNVSIFAKALVPCGLMVNLYLLPYKYLSYSLYIGRQMDGSPVS